MATRMPTAADITKVRGGGIPDVRVSAAAFGAGVGEAVEGLGSAAFAANLKFRDEAAQLEARERMVNLSKKKRHLLSGPSRSADEDAFGDDEPGDAGEGFISFYTLKKADATSRRGEYEEKLERLIEEATGGASNDLVREYMAAPIANMRNAVLNKMAEHSLREQSAHELEVHDRLMVETQQEAVANSVRIPDVLASVKDAHDEMMAWAAKTGSDPTAAKSLAQAATTKIYQAVLKDLRDRGMPGKAQELFDKVTQDSKLKDGFDPTSQGNELKLIAAKLEAEAVDKAKAALFDKPPTKEPLHTAEGAAAMRKAAETKFPPGDPRRGKLLTKVEHELDKIRVLYTRKRDDDDLEIKENAEAKIGDVAASLTDEEERVLGVAGVKAWKLAQLRAVSGDPGHTVIAKQMAWDALGVKEQAALTPEQVIEWQKGFASISQIQGHKTKKDIYDEYLAARIAVGTMNAEAHKLMKDRLAEYVKATSFSTYADIIKVGINELKLKMTDKAAAKLYSRVMKDIVREVEVNDNQQIPDSRVEELIKQNTVLIDFFPDKEVYDLSISQKEDLTNIPEMYWDEIALLVARQEGTKAAGKPLADPKLMNRAWARIRAASKTPPAKDLKAILAELGRRRRRATKANIGRMYLNGVIRGVFRVDLSGLSGAAPKPTTKSGISKAATPSMAVGEVTVMP